MSEKIGPMLAMAIGDSYGAGFEFVPQDFIQQHNSPFSGYVRHPKHIEIELGHYTDDTQMAMALALFMLSGQPLTSVNLANFFVRQYRRDPRAGYAQGFRSILSQCTDGMDFLSRIHPHSSKSGGAMRAAPCGLLDKPQLVVDRAMWQASLTHATGDGMVAAASAALLVYYCRRGVNRERKLRSSITAWCSFPWELADSYYRDQGIRVVYEAAEALKRDSLSGVLKDCVNRGGDTDTIAAIAMPAAALHPDIKQDIPENLLVNLEDGTFGKQFLMKLDQKLISTFPYSV